MKRIICILTAMLLLMTTNGMAQTVNGLFNRYEDKPGAECVNMAPLLMGIIKTFASEKSEKGKMIKSIKSIKVLDLENCTPEVKQKFVQESQELRPQGMELLMQVKDEGKNVCIWGRIKKEEVRQLVVVTDEELVNIKGKFNLDEIAKVMNSSKRK